MDNFKLNLNKWNLLSRALEGVRDCAEHMAPGARISHFGFRTTSLEQWHAMREELGGLGHEYVTRKPDGREIVFIDMGAPFNVAEHGLRYLELPQPKEHREEGQPSMIAVFRHPERTSEAWVGEYDIRHQTLGAEDIIARDAGRA